MHSRAAHRAQFLCVIVRGAKERPTGGKRKVTDLAKIRAIPGVEVSKFAICSNILFSNLQICAIPL